ncbi:MULTISPECIES: ABC transporter substrate-binding protein [unclassified Enterococcus]|uniref:ABC transporter substrate-binding protein n=1 Tax=unclassified Enterococcus TaxID=2608891 RepID=UPI0013E9E66A|nr:MULTISPECIES: ABC transporter substrate-binding protein [unclassified Enterococcus]
MKRLLLALLLFANAYLLLGCATKEPEADAPPLVIGFSQSGTESNWRKKHSRSIITALEKDHYQVLYRNGYMNQERQIQDIRTFIAYKVDMIIFTPLQEDGWEPVLIEAQKADIPVILVDRHIDVTDPTLFVTHIGPSFKAEGNRAGLYISNHFMDSAKEEVRILELAGAQNTSPTQLRSEGFRETIQQAPPVKEDGTSRTKPKMTIVHQLTGDFIRLKGKDQMKRYIENNDLSSIDVLYSHSDEMTHGALEALADTEIIPGKDLLVVTIDGQEDMIEKLRTGIVNCVVECKPDVGWYVANTVTRYFRNQETGQVLPKDIFVSETVFSKQNIGSIPTRNY